MNNRFETKDANQVKWTSFSEKLNSLTVGEDPINEFKPTIDERVAIVVDNHCYRPGYVEVYGVREGQVYVVDDLSDDMVYTLDLTVEQLMEQLKKVFI